MALAAAAAASAVFKLGGGIMAMNEANKQAKFAIQDSKRDAKDEAENVQSQISKNFVEYAKAGVALEGSPMFVINKNIDTGRQNIGRILESGRRQSKSLKAQGRAALFSAIGGAAGSVAGG